ncbi:MAG: response regulator [Desulfatiglandaceae bacterium]
MAKAARILVVDDEKAICQNVEKILKKNDFEVVKAMNAKDALEKMTNESFSLLISDIVMPETNGLELLKMVKKQWPLTKVLMMTAYASIDTAVKAIRLGALDYVPKPFTPDELRSTVDRALSGELKEADSTEKERGYIETVDVDIPFDREAVAETAGEAYARTLGPSDMPVVEAPAPETLENYCLVGERVCEIFKKLGTTCKGGVKTSECPQNKAKARKAAGKQKGFDAKTFIGIDEPFSYKEVASLTGPEYIRNLQQDGFSYVPYEALKERVAAMMEERRTIDKDIPFDREAVAKTAGEAYAETIGPSDLPAAVSPAPETLENYCLVGERVCEIFKKLGATCKGGVKTSECPQNKAKARKAAGKQKGFDAKTFIGIDQPFNYDEVASVTGPGYVSNLHFEGTMSVPYEELRENVAKLLKGKEQATEFVNDVLVIDDEVAVNNNIRKILSKKGFEVDQATTREEALEKIAQNAYRLVLLDLKIPGVKGLELLRAVRDTRPEAMVIIITGYASIETAVETARLGAVDYLPKPFTPAEVRDMAENALRLAA